MPTTSKSLQRLRDLDYRELERIGSSNPLHRFEIENNLNDARNIMNNQNFEEINQIILNLKFIQLRKLIKLLYPTLINAMQSDIQLQNKNFFNVRNIAQKIQPFIKRLSNSDIAKTYQKWQQNNQQISHLNIIAENITQLDTQPINYDLSTFDEYYYDRLNDIYKYAQRNKNINMIQTAHWLRNIRKFQIEATQILNHWYESILNPNINRGFQINSVEIEHDLEAIQSLNLLQTPAPSPTDHNIEEDDEALNYKAQTYVDNLKKALFPNSNVNSKNNNPANGQPDSKSPSSTTSSSNNQSSMMPKAQSSQLNSPQSLIQDTQPHPVNPSQANSQKLSNQLPQAVNSTTSMVNQPATINSNAQSAINQNTPALANSNYSNSNSNNKKESHQNLPVPYQENSNQNLPATKNPKMVNLSLWQKFKLNLEHIVENIKHNLNHHQRR